MIELVTSVGSEISEIAQSTRLGREARNSTNAESRPIGPLLAGTPASRKPGWKVRAPIGRSFSAARTWLLLNTNLLVPLLTSAPNVPAIATCPLGSSKPTEQPGGPGRIIVRGSN